MRKIKNSKAFSLRAWKTHLKAVKRKRRYRRKVAGNQKFLHDANLHRRISENYQDTPTQKVKTLKHNPIIPEYTENLKFLLSQR